MSGSPRRRLPAATARRTRSGLSGPPPRADEDGGLDSEWGIAALVDRFPDRRHHGNDPRLGYPVTLGVAEPIGGAGGCERQRFGEVEPGTVEQQQDRKVARTIQG